MIRKMSETLNWIENFLFFLGGLLIVFSMLTIAMEVISRYFFDYSFIWVNEINEYILLYIPFLGGAWLIRENAHVTIDLIEGYLSRKMKKLNHLFIAAIGIFICIALLWYGLQSVVDSFARDMRSISVIQVPQVYVLAIIPVGSFVMLLEFIRMFYQNAIGEYGLLNNRRKSREAA